MSERRRNLYLRVGLAITGVITLLAVLGCFWTPYDPSAMNSAEMYAAPSLRHLFGTDNFGRDVFSRVMKGVSTTYLISLATVALGVAFIPSYARVVRSEFARHREMNYVKSAHLMGATHRRIMFVHILPNTRAVILPTLVIGFNNAVLAEASMSYLGIGVRSPDVSLGYMLSESQSYMSSAPWYVLCTGMTIVLLILGFSLVGEGLQQEGR